MEAQWLSVIFIGLGFVLTLVAQAFTLASALNRARKEIDDDAEIRAKEILRRIEQEGRMVGETIAAIRQELANHKLYSAETYQRRDSFHQQMTAFNQAMSSRFEKIEDKLDRIFLHLRGDKKDGAR